MSPSGEARAAVMPGPGLPLELHDLPLPELQPGEALLATEFSEVCGTDVHLMHGRLEGVPYPIIPGHVACGVLERVHGELFDVEGNALREGQRVTFLDVHRTCNACWACLVAKASTRCPHRKVYGITYGLQDGLAGGWATHIHMKQGVRCVPLGEVDAKTFMAGGCGLPTALHAVDRAGIRIGDVVLVLGSGPVGLSAVRLALLSGAERVLCIGGPAARLDAALGMGAADVLDIATSGEEQRLEWVLAATGGRGADVCLEATGVPEAVRQAMVFTRDAGCVVVVGQYTDNGPVAINPHTELNRKHLDVRGCWGSDFSHFHRGVQLLGDAGRAAPWGRLIVTTYGLAQVEAALAAVAAGDVVKALIDPRVER